MKYLAATAVLVALVVCGVRLDAAEISCLQTYDGTTYPADIASKLWPSGFRPTAGMCQRALIRGKILKDDYQKVLAFYRNNHRVLSGFALVSAGGSVAEAIKIGSLFRKYLMRASAPIGLPNKPQYSALPGVNSEPICQGSECNCASACALIWFGAIDRSGLVGLHRPRIDDPEFKGLPPAEASALYRRVLEETERYMTEMEVPRPLIDAMLATPSSEIRWIDAAEDNLSRPPSYAEWEDAACGAIAMEQHRHWQLWEKRADHQSLTNDEQLLLQALSEKITNNIRCSMYLRTSSIERLPLP